MKYQEAKIENGEVKIINSINVHQEKLTSDCWLIQIKGLEVCKSCEYKNTEECGGGETLKNLHKKLKELGYD